MGVVLEAIDWRSVALVLVLGAGAVLWTLIKGAWVPGAKYTEMREDRDYWRNLALEGLGVAKEAAGVAAKEIGR